MSYSPAASKRRELLQTYTDLIGRRGSVISDLWTQTGDDASCRCSADASRLYSACLEASLEESRHADSLGGSDPGPFDCLSPLFGIRVASLPAAVIAAAVLGILNALVRPVLQFFALPITFLTLGLFYFVINGLMLYWTASLVQGFAVRSFGAAILGSIFVSVLSLILNFVLKPAK